MSPAARRNFSHNLSLTDQYTSHGPIYIPRTNIHHTDQYTSHGPIYTSYTHPPTNTQTNIHHTLTHQPIHGPIYIIHPPTNIHPTDQYTSYTHPLNPYYGFILPTNTHRHQSIHLEPCCVQLLCPRQDWTPLYKTENQCPARLFALNIAIGWRWHWLARLWCLTARSPVLDVKELLTSNDWLLDTQCF